MTEQAEQHPKTPEALREGVIARISGEAQRLTDASRVFKIPLTLDTTAHLIAGRVSAAHTRDGIDRQIIASSIVGPHETHVAVTVLPLTVHGEPLFTSVEQHQALEATTGAVHTNEYLADLAQWCDAADFDPIEPYQAIASRSQGQRYATWRAIHLDNEPLFKQ